MSNTTEKTMEKFIITIKKVTKLDVEVEATDLDSAIKDVRSRYKNEEFVLDSDNFTGADFFDGNAE